MFHQFLFNLVVRLHIRHGESLENVVSFLIKLSTDDELPLILVDTMEFGSFLKQNKIFQHILIRALVWNKFARIVYDRVGMSLNIVLICFWSKFNFLQLQLKLPITFSLIGFSLSVSFSLIGFSLFFFLLEFSLSLFWCLSFSYSKLLSRYSCSFLIFLSISICRIRIFSNSNSIFNSRTRELLDLILIDSLS